MGRMIGSGRQINGLTTPIRTFEPASEGKRLNERWRPIRGLVIGDRGWSRF